MPLDRLLRLRADGSIRRTQPGRHQAELADITREVAERPKRPGAVVLRGPLTVVQIDAHLDAGTEIGGERQTNCNGLIRATELDNLGVENMAVIGVRGTINVPDWWDAVRERGIPVYPMSTLKRDGVEETVSGVLDRVWNGVDAVYVTFDTDSIDSAFAPGTTGPEPGGFSSHEIIRIGQMIGERGVTAIDNVELCPVYDPSGITARLVWEVLSQMLYAHAKHHL